MDRAIDLLETLYRSSRPLGVTDLSKATGLSKAATHHLLRTLETRRFVMRDPETRNYQLSWALYELGVSVVRDLDLARAARPFLDALAQQIDESVLLGILDTDSVLYIDRAEAPSGLRMVATAGRRGVLPATASGKVLLAFTQDPQLLGSMLRDPLHRYTPSTITDPAVLRRQLADVRRQRYATCWEEREVGISSLAVPLRNYSGNVVGSLAIAGPSARLNETTVTAHLAPLRACAEQIEVRLGANDGTPFA